ncbi:MAG: glycerophosphodiester phosphodiesterase [Nitrospirales bacterium]
MNSRRSTGHLLSGVFISALCFGCTSLSPPVACELPHSPVPSLPERGISAHRGGILGCPVNTIGAFQRAICHGVHQIEFDVRITADEELVIAHDDHVTDAHGKKLMISETTLSEVQALRFKPCKGEDIGQNISTLEEVLTMMPQNIWLNVDIKENNPRVTRLVAEVVAKTNRFHQVIFSSRKPADLAVHEVANKAGVKSWVGNMSRQFFRSQYIKTTIHACDEFIQLTFLRGRPNRKTIIRLQQKGVRINYSWLRTKKKGKLRKDLHDLFDRKVDFVLVDHAKPALEVACDLGIPPVIPQLNGKLPSFCPISPRCDSDS